MYDYLMEMTTEAGKMGMDMNDGNDHRMMWMWFHTTINDTVLFDFWHVKTVGEMILSCVLVFLMGLCFEGIKWLRWWVEMRNSRTITPVTIMTMYATIEILPSLKSMRYAEKLVSPHHLIQTLLFGLQIVVSYLLMLVFMTFSIWLGLAVTLGTAVGYYLFGSRHDPDVCRTGNLNSQSSNEACCG